MKERPILFNGDMVRAILDGRKSQTRRVVKFPRMYAQPDFIGGSGDDINDPTNWGYEDAYHGTGWWALKGTADTHEIGNPFGQPGDRLWSRETWAETPNPADSSPTWPDRPHISLETDWDGINRTVVIWRADGEWSWVGDDGWFIDKTNWKPSIYMPRWASRILLEVTDVRVERVQQINRPDAIAEGCPYTQPDGRAKNTDPVAWFATLWDSINAKRGYSWESNPWVWVVSFKRVEA